MSFLESVENQTLNETVSRTGQWKGKDAYIVEVLGNREGTFNSNSILHDLCEFLENGEYIYLKPTTADTFVVNSTSANDTAAGTGTRTVQIAYLDASGDEQAVTVALNG